MLGDVLIIKDKHKTAAAQILEIIDARPREKQVIAIGGESGSGKTEVAHELACQLKKRENPAKIMHIDNYYRVPPRERTAWRQAHGLESIGYTEYDWELINRNLDDFRADRDQVVMPCIDLLTDQVDQLHTSFQGLQYLIIEGLYAVKADADLKFLIDLTYRETKNMQFARGKEPINDYRWQVLEREHQVVQSLRPLTDLLITADFQIKKLQ
ncbi:MAG: zeta toxin family protein [Anaerolineales bacterium]|nr:zeta toxin family protein [Anaerolineales bacterium]